MGWLKEVMGGLEQLMELSKQGTGGGRQGALWREAQYEAYKNVANLLAFVAKVEKPYPDVTIDWR